MPLLSVHAVKDGCLDQLDLPHWPSSLAAVRQVEALVPRITRDWHICHGPVTFRVMLPDDLAPGAVVEWADTGQDIYGWHYTVVMAADAASVTFADHGHGPEAALAAMTAANRLRAWKAA